jgi:hypothetical protein
MVGETNVYKDIKYYHFIFVILQGFLGTKSKVHRG